MVVTLFPIAIGGVQSKLETPKAWGFSLELVTVPASNSSFEDGFMLADIEGLTYFSPTVSSYFWVTGDGPLPCTNEQIIAYYKKHYGFYPQLRAESIKEGFLMKRSLD